MVTEVADENFDSEVLKSTVPAVVDFWAPWCGPCFMIDPIMEKLAKQYDSRVKFCRLNIDENPRTAMKYQIMSIPLVMLFKHGEQVDSCLGAVPERILQPKVEALL